MFDGSPLDGSPIDRMRLVPQYITEATAFIAKHHRHNRPPRGGLFAVGVACGETLVGVAVAGRTTARGLHDGRTVEVTRCCVLEAAPTGAPSMLYGALWRAARALGWSRLITYTLQRESGVSLRAAGWKRVVELPARGATEWTNRGKGRLVQAVVAEPKIRWEVCVEKPAFDWRRAYVELTTCLEEAISVRR